MKIFPFAQVLSYPILGLEDYLLRGSRPLPLMLSYTSFVLFRIGGASAAANNDLTDRIIRKYGRWKYEKV